MGCLSCFQQATGFGYKPERLANRDRYPACVVVVGFIFQYTLFGIASAKRGESYWSAMPMIISETHVMEEIVWPYVSVCVTAPHDFNLSIGVGREYPSISHAAVHKSSVGTYRSLASTTKCQTMNDSYVARSAAPMTRLNRLLMSVEFTNDACDGSWLDSYPPECSQWGEGYGTEYSGLIFLHKNESAHHRFAQESYADEAFDRLLQGGANRFGQGLIHEMTMRMHIDMYDITSFQQTSVNFVPIQEPVKSMVFGGTGAEWNAALTPEDLYQHTMLYPGNMVRTNWAVLRIMLDPEMKMIISHTKPTDDLWKVLLDMIVIYLGTLPVAYMFMACLDKRCSCTNKQCCRRGDQTRLVDEPAIQLSNLPVSTSHDPSPSIPV